MPPFLPITPSLISHFFSQFYCIFTYYFGPFLHLCVVRHFPAGLCKCLQPVPLPFRFSSDCITSVVSSSWPVRDPGPLFLPWVDAFFVSRPKLSFPLADYGTFVFFCPSRSQTRCRKCFHSPFLGGVMPPGRILKPEERPPKIGLCVEAWALETLRISKGTDTLD